ncbi:MAG TPA: STAS domain-containing protein [Candidatus Xenobia bacterium]|jgi:anti-sigma B factor antagonist
MELLEHPLPGGSSAKLTTRTLRPGLRLLVVEGDLDYYSAPELSAQFQRRVEDKPVDYIIDLTEVGYIDTSGLGFLLSLSESVRQREGRLVVALPQRRHRQLLARTRLDQIFCVTNTRDEARARLEKGGTPRP